MTYLRLISLFMVFLSGCSSDDGATPQPNPAPAILHCSEVKTEADCDLHSYGQEYCMFKNNQCVQITACSDISNRKICDNSPGIFQGCAWDNVGKQCLKPDPTTCQALKTQGETFCNANPTCYWTKDSDCQLVSSCDKIKNNTDDKCNNFNSGSLHCQWAGNPASCSNITNCESVTAGLEECERHYFQNSYCQWTGSPGTCSAITQCTDIKLQADCSWWPGDKCTWSSSGACIKTPPPPPTSCEQISSQPDCTSSTLNCEWLNNACSQIDGCPTIPDQAQCNAQTQFACQWVRTCNVITDCASVQVDIKCSGKSYQGSACNWYTNVCDLANPSTCASISYKSVCNNSTIYQHPCLWNNSACANDTRSCQPNQSACSGHGSPGACAGDSNCTWGGTCSVKSSVCSGQLKSNCNSQYCSWQ